MNKLILTFAFFVIIVINHMTFVEAFNTINPGIVRVAVTAIPEEGKENAASWTLDFFKEFEKAQNIKVEFVVSSFNHSWLLPNKDQVDIVATGVTALSERQNEGATFSRPYLQVKRGLRIHGGDSHLFTTINDFVGYRIGAVKGMTAAMDLYNRAPSGVEVIEFDSWESMYASFYAHEIHAVAEGYYVSVDRQINHNDPDFPMIDDHDLIEGEPEYLVFVVRNKSEEVLEAINNLLSNIGFPVR